MKSAVRFPRRSTFYPVLKERVETYFESRGLHQTGNRFMFLKTAFILLWFASAYALLVFFSTSLIVAIITALLLGQAYALVGFNIMHDGGHDSYSRHKKVNTIMSFTLDLLGGSQMLWRHKHNVLHHTFTNITALDNDLYSAGLLRLSPHDKWHWWHRFQHWYAIPVYSLLSLSIVTIADFRKFFGKRIGSYQLPRFKTSESVVFFLTKIFYVTYTIAIPLLFHSVLHVLIAFIAVHLVMGFTFSIVFQLAHIVDGTEFPLPDEKTGVVDSVWAVHEVETTANFAPNNRLLGAEAGISAD